MIICTVVSSYYYFFQHVPKSSLISIYIYIYICIRANLLLEVIHLFLVSSTRNFFSRTIRLLVGGFDVRNQ